MKTMLVVSAAAMFATVGVQIHAQQSTFNGLNMNLGNLSRLSHAQTRSISAENFTSAIGTVMFVAYLSALCKNPLHTATQYALLTALAAVGRTYLSSGAGFIAEATGWVWFFVICAAAGIPSLLLLVWLQRREHFVGLEPKTK